MKIDHIGYGAGQRDHPIPNLLRVSVGVLKNAYEEDVVSLIQTNIDDMNHDGVVKNISPSYEECRKVATYLNIPLKKVYQEAKQAAFDLLAKKANQNIS